jgi:general secretion pathway protein G
MRVRRRRKSGFTLLELLLVMAILVVLASLSTFAILSIQGNALKRTAFLQIQTLEEACTMFKLSVGRYPTTLDELHVSPSGMTKSQWGGPYLDDPVPMDPWGNAYKFAADELNDRVTITSSGKDRQSGTEDDVPEPTAR